MEEHNAFTLVDREFFETIDRYRINPTYVDRLQSLVPGGWSVSRSGIWVMASNGVPGPAQGFKIHVSSVPRHALSTLDLVVPECTRRGVQFKIAADPGLLNLLNSKRYGRGGSGKFMTIYPGDTDIFRDLIEALYRATSGTDLAGPYILSDRRYKDSKIIYYRYGGFARIDRLQPDGTSDAVILSPENEPLVDDRAPYYQLPPWVKDPFGAEPAPQDATPVLNGRYSIDGVIGFSNTGGVYYGTDAQTGAEVILKEARPHTAHWTVGELSIDAVTLLEREHEVLKRLWPTGIVPEPIELFKQWEHTFLVQSRVPGITLQQFWSTERNILAPYVDRPGRIERFITPFRRVARELMAVIEKVHAQGIVLGDLSPNNVLIEPETLTLRLIDFESAIIDGEEDVFMGFSRNWVTPGFDNPDRANRKTIRVEDDFYALAMLLYGAVVPVQPFFALHPGARDQFLDYFIGLGVHREIRQIINELLAGRLDEARTILDAWEADEPADAWEWTSPEDPADDGAETTAETAAIAA